MNSLIDGRFRVINEMLAESATVLLTWQGSLGWTALSKAVQSVNRKLRTRLFVNKNVQIRPSPEMLMAGCDTLQLSSIPKTNEKKSG
jgi:hypothetical protein